MKIVINVAVGLLLFVGALVGGLAATGRLNHEGTANIPVLGGFFPAPPEADPAHPTEGDAHGEAGKDGAAADAHGTTKGEAANADHSGAEGTPQEAAGELQDPQGEGDTRRTKNGKSVVQPEAKPDDGHGGGGGEHGGGEGGGEHGAADAGHGETPAGHEKKPAKETAGHGGKAPTGEAPSPEKDFSGLEHSLANDRKNKYAPGGYFTFEGMPAGLTPEQLNEAWQRVKAVLGDLEQRKTVLDLREKDLQVLSDDIDNRIRRIAEERLRVENMARQLDERIAKFQEQVKLVRNDEVPALKRNAQTIASFERQKAADLLAEQWLTEKGKDDVLKTFEFMDKDAVNEILAAMSPVMAQDVMKMRLRVSKEAAPSATPGK